MKPQLVASIPALCVLALLARPLAALPIDGSEFIVEIRARPIFATVDGAGKVHGFSESIYRETATLSTGDEAAVTDTGPLDSAPANAIGNDLFIKAKAGDVADEPGTRQLVVNLEGSIDDCDGGIFCRGGIFDIGSRIIEVAQSQPPPAGKVWYSTFVSLSLLSVDFPADVWVESLASSRLQHYNSMTTNHDPAADDLPVNSKTWRNVLAADGSIPAVSGGSDPCPSPDQVLFRFEFETGGALPFEFDILEDAAIRWVIFFRERPLIICELVVFPLPFNDWIHQLIKAGAMDPVLGKDIDVEFNEMRAELGAINQVEDTKIAETRLQKLGSRLAEFIKKIQSLRSRFKPEIYKELESRVKKSQQLLAGAIARHAGSPASGGQFPGDINQDALVDISDAVGLLGHLFLGEPRVLPCDATAAGDPVNVKLLDWSGDGKADLSDPIGMLVHFFRGGPEHALGPIGRCVAIAGCPSVCD